MSLLSREAWEALPYKRNLRGEEALAAVKHDAFALRFVKDQTEELCIAAVKQNGYTLQYVKDQTPEICLAAVKQNPDALQYVEERFLDEPDVLEEIILNGIRYRRVKD